MTASQANLEELLFVIGHFSVGRNYPSHVEQVKMVGVQACHLETEVDRLSSGAAGFVLASRWAEVSRLPHGGVEAAESSRLS